MDGDVFAAAAVASSDRVEWRLYVDGDAAGCDASPAALQDALAACLAHATPLLRDHIWQRDPFTLALLPAGEGGADTPVCLGGAAHVGDAVEDEWFIAWLVFELTRQLPQLSARVWDSDGEFLLIEAAFSLPKWARKPEATVDRVFVRGGELRLVPPPPRRTEGAPRWTLRDGLRAVTHDADGATLAPEPVRAALATALAGFPARAAAQAHTARARVPARIAALLRGELQLLAPAVAAFYERDPAAVRAAARMAFFPPDELVTVAVRFTRVLYAQLVQQRFDPSRRWPLPPPAHPEHRAATLGAKLAAGFEMLAADWARAGAPLPPPQHAVDATAGASADVVAQAAAAQLPSEDDPGWRAFVASLERTGYFRGNIPGSRDHTAARRRAADAYVASQAHARFVAAAAAPAARAAALLAPEPRAADFGPAPGPEADDREDWLLEGEALLESALAARTAERAAHDARRAKRAPPDAAAAADMDADAAAADLADVARGVRGFVGARGSMHGASLPDNVAGGPPGLQVDPFRFLKELSGALGLDWDELRAAAGDVDEDDSSATSSSASEDLSDDFDVATEDEEDSDDERAPGAAAAAGDDWRRFVAADSGSDSDDASSSGSERSGGGGGGGGGGFNAAYAAALSDQLRGTAMETDFARAPHAAAAAAPAAEEGAAAPEEALRPVDVDLNLVQSLLASYTAQEGLPGPASNLLGALGLALPDDADRRATGRE